MVKNNSAKIIKHATKLFTKLSHPTIYRSYWSASHYLIFLFLNEIIPPLAILPRSLRWSINSSTAIVSSGFLRRKPFSIALFNTMCSVLSKLARNALSVGSCSVALFNSHVLIVIFLVGRNSLTWLGPLPLNGCEPPIFWSFNTVLVLCVNLRIDVLKK